MVVVVVTYDVDNGLSVLLDGHGERASRPDSSSCKTTKAWCGRLPLPSSLATSSTLMLSVLVMVTGWASGFVSENLC